MRAIGKGSLASILAIGLHVTRIILVIAVVGLTIAMVMIPFASGLIAFVGGFDNVDIDGDIGIDIADYFDIAYSFVAAVVMLYVVNRLLEILLTLRLETPFVKENADRFRAVGYALLIGEGAKFVFAILGVIFGAELDIDFEFIAWLAIIAVFVLSEVFMEGARMKEEQDLTV
ncbi:MAG: DUF2975 domain-containing protein [Pseudomonadota bacterium]